MRASAVAAGAARDEAVLNHVYQTVCGIDAAAPRTLQFPFERLWLTETREWAGQSEERLRQSPGRIGRRDQERGRHGVKPTVRGSVMNPNDHPHGGGEGRTSIGRKAPMTPWGKKAMGVKTRKNKKASTKLIVRRRNSK